MPNIHQVFFGYHNFWQRHFVMKLIGIFTSSMDGMKYYSELRGWWNSIPWHGFNAPHRALVDAFVGVYGWSVRIAQMFWPIWSIYIYMIYVLELYSKGKMCVLGRVAIHTIMTSCILFPTMLPLSSQRTLPGQDDPLELAPTVTVSTRIIPFLVWRISWNSSLNPHFWLASWEVFPMFPDPKNSTKTRDPMRLGLVGWVLLYAARCPLVGSGSRPKTNGPSNQDQPRGSFGRTGLTGTISHFFDTNLKVTNCLDAKKFWGTI